MILVVVNYLIVIALFYIGISTHTAISTRIILATSTNIVKLLFDATILNWFLKYDYELLDIIIVGFQQFGRRRRRRRKEGKKEEARMRKIELFYC